MTNKTKIRASRKVSRPRVKRTPAVRPAIKGLNVKLLRRIQKHILEEPRRFFMHWFIARQHGDKTFPSDNDTKQAFAPCGTAACIAGWVNFLTKGPDPTDADRARIQLGLPVRAFSDISYDPLFDVGGWPKKFEDQYRKALSVKQRARIAAKRIDCLIKEGK